MLKTFLFFILLIPFTCIVQAPLRFEKEVDKFRNTATDYSEDNLHINKKGYDLWIKQIEPLLLKK